MELNLKNVSLGFSDRELVRDVNIEVSGGQFVGLLGRNGTGKSTLLRSLAGLVKPKGGEIFVDGKNLFEMKSVQRARLVAFVSTESVRVAHLKVWDVVAFGRSPYSSWSGALSDEDNRMVIEALEKVGMLDFKNKDVDTLSDGERGRVMIARALAQECGILLLDEPTAFLDLPNRYHIMELLRNLAHTQGKLIVLSTHELNLAVEMADSLWILDNHRLACGPVDEMATSQALSNTMKLH